MSSQSGLAVPPALSAAFTTALSAPETRALVLTIPDSTAYALHATVPAGSRIHPSAPSGATQAVSDIAALLPALPSAGTCASFLYRADAEWMLISYIPDSAPTRQKMLHASSKSTLLKQLNPIHQINTTLFFTSPGDLTPTAFDAALKSRDAPPPMTKSEEALRDIKQEEAREAQERLERMFGATTLAPPSQQAQPPQRTGGTPSPGLKPHVFGAPQPIKQRSTDSQYSAPSPTSPIGSGGAGLARGGIGAMGAILGGASGLGAGADKGSLKWAEGVEEALKALLKGDSQGYIVVLVRSFRLPIHFPPNANLAPSPRQSIDAKSETIILHPSSTGSAGSCAPDQLASRLPSKEPSYAFYAWPATTTAKTSVPKPEKKDSLAVPGVGVSALETTNGAAGESGEVDPKDIALPVSPLPSSPVGDTEAAPSADSFPASASAPAAQSSAATVAFIYACPAASPVRNRMLFSTCVRGLIRAAEERCGVKISKKVSPFPSPPFPFPFGLLGAARVLRVATLHNQIETSDIAELSPSFLRAEMFDSAPPIISVPRSASGTPTPSNGNGSGVDTSSVGTGDAWNAFGPRVGRPKPAGRR
ncbi:hypothetical protein QFC19_004027 [Naganishia cerealis]|uniref:Uncharacterized protein n=1 Tax=Naganishia cerealis TaxID=610337 RepID=A0ACC2VYM8_9TREE|nr:hypothetical protein QFC19_004027 [Naganishia cerealis]